MDKKFIRGIVETYDLPPKLEARITNIAITGIEEHNFSNIADQYDYIAWLVDKFTNLASLGARLPISLDAEIKPNSHLRLYDLITSPYDNDKKGLEEENGVDILSLEELLNLLRERLDKKGLNLLSTLLPEKRRKMMLYVNYPKRDITRNYDDIAYRLAEIAETFDRNGKIMIPPRPIIQVKFKPLRIKFGRRNYNGNPLSFFEQHRENYQGMKRKELKHYDSGLYTALRIQRQLDKAIPDSWLLSEQEKEIIRRTFIANDGYLYKTAQQLGYAHQTIKKVCREGGLKVIWGGRPLPQENIDEIIKCYIAYNGNAHMSARHLPYSYKTVWKYWKKYGLQAKGNSTKSNLPFPLAQSI